MSGSSGRAGLNAHLKVGSLVAGMIASADSIYDVSLLRHDALPGVFGRIQSRSVIAPVQVNALGSPQRRGFGRPRGPPGRGRLVTRYQVALSGRVLGSAVATTRRRGIVWPPASQPRVGGLPGLGVPVAERAADRRPVARTFRPAPGQLAGRRAQSKAARRRQPPQRYSLQYLW
jgi:hypothetical protein